MTKPIRPQELVAAIRRTPPRHTSEKAAESSKTEGAIDGEAFRRFVESVGGDDDPGFVTELIGQFLKDAPALLGAIRDGLRSGDAEAIRRAAHTLKSNAATFGATELSARSRSLELDAADGELADAAPLADEIASALEEAISALSDRAADRSGT